MDHAFMFRLDLQIAELDMRANLRAEKQKAEKVSQPGKRSLAEVSKQNQLRNMENALRNVGSRPEGSRILTADGVDPFSRRQTRPMNYWSTKKNASGEGKSRLPTLFLLILKLSLVLKIEFEGLSKPFCQQGLLACWFIDEARWSITQNTEMRSSLGAHCQFALMFTDVVNPLFLRWFSCTLFCQLKQRDQGCCMQDQIEKA